MTLDDGLRPSHTHLTKDDIDKFLVKNHFEDLPLPTYTSALSESAVRRRHGSEGTPGWLQRIQDGSDEWTVKHGRTWTGDWGHPLDEDVVETDNVTRPALGKLVGSIASGSNSSSTSDEDTAVESQEKAVLVHVISPNDTFAGVSLKYGISMAELRKANHMWTSDSIHLRSILYIPLDLCSKSVRLQPPSLTDTSTVRRVPASQLSFFPPPSTPLASKPQPPTIPAIRPSPTRTLSSLLGALPETITARLSLDSSRSSNDEHELIDVRPVIPVPGTVKKLSPPPRTPPSSTMHYKSYTAQPFEHDTPQGKQLVRTSQMEPSPRMEVPRSRSRPRSSKGSSLI